MQFCFYPNHEHGCEYVSHCPHLGSASLGSLVLAANEQHEFHRYLHGTIDAERERNATLSAENERLRTELEQVKLELKLERQNKFATNKQKQADSNDEAQADEADPEDDSKPVAKKRGAPVGHPGWFRPMPTEYDWDVDVPVPSRCPHCRGTVTSLPSVPADEHLQEDIIDGQYRVVLYRHPVAQCAACEAWVQQPGQGEILRSRIGPYLRSKALYLRNVIGISYRKVPAAIDEMFGIRFTPAALLGFENALMEKAEQVVEDIAKKLGASDGPVHADETYWTLDGDRAYFWVHGNERFVHFQFDATRAGQVSRDVLGDHFTGTLVTDCYSAYFAHTAGAKQKCLVHIARTARDWQKLVKKNTEDYQYFAAIRQFVSRSCDFYKNRRDKKLSESEIANEVAWLRAELTRLETCEVTHAKAVTLQKRLLRHPGEWLVFIDDTRVPPSNNLAERALRPLVVLRKITFGHRTEAGANRMARLMTISETARRHGHRASDIYFDLYTRPPNQVLRNLYAAN